MRNRRNIDIPGAGYSLPNLEPMQLEDWTLDISPEEYARRVLYFYQRDDTRTVAESLDIANVNTLCTPDQAMYVEGIVWAYIAELTGGKES